MQAVDNSGDIVDIKALHRSHDRSGLPAVSAVTGETADAGLHVYSFTGKRQHPRARSRLFVLTCSGLGRSGGFVGQRCGVQRSDRAVVRLVLMTRQKDVLLTMNELCSVC